MRRIHIRNLPEGTSIIIDKVMAEAVSRVLGASLVFAYDFNLNKLTPHKYNNNGIRCDGINPLTKKGHLE